MTLSLTCNHCKLAITGEDEDELVVNVQEHVGEHSRAHGVSHVVTREQVLHRLRRQQEKEAAGRNE
ncbi:hypothetical protein [Streptomyces prunicolor]|uniref:hypothetical protein n=1 Tax=Streptomyces prunicolor TaxID=67348 RepID=UPI00341CC837